MADRYRHSNGRYRIRKRPLILALALVLLAGLGVGATLGLLSYPDRGRAERIHLRQGKLPGAGIL